MGAPPRTVGDATRERGRTRHGMVDESLSGAQGETHPWPERRRSRPTVRDRNDDSEWELGRHFVKAERGVRSLVLLSTTTLGSALLVTGAAAWAELDSGSRLPTWILGYGVVALAGAMFGFARPSSWRVVVAILAAPALGSLTLATIALLGGPPIALNTLAFALALGVQTAVWTVIVLIAFIIDQRRSTP